MRRREEPRDPQAPPVELERFQVSEWVDRSEAVPESAYEHLKHNRGSTAAECEAVWRGVQAVRRYLDARREWQDMHNGAPAQGSFVPASGGSWRTAPVVPRPSMIPVRTRPPGVPC